MNLLESASTWLQRQVHAYTSIPIVYRRGTDATELAAGLGHSDFEVYDELGIAHKVRSRDYLVLESELVIAGKPVFPDFGDRIEESDGTTTYVYEVMAPAGRPVWWYSDPYRTMLRVHTKQTATIKT